MVSAFVKTSSPPCKHFEFQGGDNVTVGTLECSPTPTPHPSVALQIRGASSSTGKGTPAPPAASLSCAPTRRKDHPGPDSVSILVRSPCIYVRAGPIAS